MDVGEVVVGPEGGDDVAEAIAQVGDVTFVDIDGLFGGGGSWRWGGEAGAVGLDEFSADDVAAGFFGEAAVGDGAGGAEVAVGDGGAEGEACAQGECDGDVETDAAAGEVADEAAKGLAAVDEFDNSGDFIGRGGAGVAPAITGGLLVGKLSGKGGKLFQIGNVVGHRRLLPLTTVSEYVIDIKMGKVN